jgi:hypothetical protein
MKQEHYTTLLVLLPSNTLPSSTASIKKPRMSGYNAEQCKGNISKIRQANHCLPNARLPMKCKTSNEMHSLKTHEILFFINLSSLRPKP